VTGTLTVRLARADTGEIVEATLTDAISGDVAQRADRTWSTFCNALEAQKKERAERMPRTEHGHWNWEWKLSETGHLLAYSGYAVEVDGDVQGLMLLRTAGDYGRLTTQAQQPLVYVVYVQTAPWNDSRLVEQRRYRGVGTVLLRAAVELSFELEFKGRIGLHSLPQAESWSDKLEITCVGEDANKERFKYYEMTPEQAHAFVREEEP
jgi:hypothetical protein